MRQNEIIVIYADSLKEDTKVLLGRARPEEEIGDKNTLICLKPNLVSERPASSGATTHVEIVAGVVEYFFENGYKNLKIMEGSWVGARTKNAFKACGYEDLSQKYGVELLDLQNDRPVKKQADGMSIEVCESVLKAGYIVNLPVLKGHCQTTITCALKNMKGVITNGEKRRFHQMGLHRPIAVLNSIIAPDLTLVDGICGDLNFEEGGNPAQMDRIIVGKDPVLLDAYAAELMGIPQSEVPYIKMAQALGVGSSDLLSANISEINPGRRTAVSLPSGLAKRLSAHIEEKEACSACYGSLIHALCRMQENGTLKNLPGKIKIGQGYRGVKGKGVGVGTCTGGCEKSVGGCPPTARSIREFLEGLT